jgi:hypothetical protein
MKRLSIVPIALVALVGSAVGLYVFTARVSPVGPAVGLSTAESETFTGAAAASGTYKRPQLLVDGKRYELKASDTADASVADMLARFSKGDTGTYVVKGRRGTVNGVDGIIFDSIAPAAHSSARARPAARPGSFNVKDFGARGDGVADDTSAAQSAINAAAKNAGGGTVIFPKGTYLLNSAYPSRHP